MPPLYIYQNFIENEIKWNKQFLNKYQIYGDRFDSDQYLTIKEIWKDSKFICSIYEIIEDILKKENNAPNCVPNSELRHLIFGDFIFALISVELRDPSSLAFKITRHKYMYSCKLRENIFKYITNSTINYIKIHQKLLIGLRANNLIKKSEIRTKINSWRTIIYLEMKITINFNINYILSSCSKTPFIIITLFNTNYSISNFRNIAIVKRKKPEMNEFEINLNSIIKANQISYTLSQNLYILNKKNIDLWEKETLEKLRCATTEEYIKNCVLMFKEGSYGIAEKNKYINKLQKMFVFIILKQNIFNKYFYLPCFCDNRGRQYYATMLSPTFSHTIRNLIEFNKQICEFNELTRSEFYIKIIKYKYILNSDYQFDNIKTYVLIILFIEIGKFFTDNNNEYIIKTENIINSGINNYRSKNKKIEYKHLLYIEKIYALIDNLLDKNIVEFNTIIYKDATSSGLQNYGILLGYKKEMLKYLNIDNDDWCDTYQYLINKFLINCKYTKRKYWKHTIMTIPYNSVWYSCFIKFISNLRKDNIEYNTLNKEEQDQIKQAHHEFYINIKTKLKNEFYENSINCNMIPFSYSKISIDKIKEYKINYKKQRDKYTSITYLSEYDCQATNTSLEANNMHYLDAKLVKFLLNKYEILTIHDCFGIRLC